MVIDPKAYTQRGLPKNDLLRLVLQELKSRPLADEACELAVAVECCEIVSVEHLGVGGSRVGAS